MMLDYKDLKVSTRTVFSLTRPWGTTAEFVCMSRSALQEDQLASCVGDGYGRGKMVLKVMQNSGPPGPEKGISNNKREEGGNVGATVKLQSLSFSPEPPSQLYSSVPGDLLCMICPPSPPNAVRGNAETSFFPAITQCPEQCLAENR